MNDRLSDCKSVILMIIGYVNHLLAFLPHTYPIVICAQNSTLIDRSENNNVL